jgi:hypothetical protein
MLPDIQHNNKILSPQDRIEFNKTADEWINNFSESIDGMYELGEEFCDLNNIHHWVTKVITDVSVFISYAFADCIVLTKLFVNTSSVYEKSMLRGKLKVHLNESFKRLYGFEERTYKKSYCAQMKEIMPYFPGFDQEFSVILADLDEISKRDSWWRDVRNAEVHIDIPELYKFRHEEINESKVAIETLGLIRFFNRFNDLLSRMNQAHINYMFDHLSVEGKIAALKEIYYDSNPTTLSNH